MKGCFQKLTLLIPAGIDELLVLLVGDLVPVDQVISELGLGKMIEAGDRERGLPALYPHHPCRRISVRIEGTGHLPSPTEGPCRRNPVRRHEPRLRDAPEVEVLRHADLVERRLAEALPRLLLAPVGSIRDVRASGRARDGHFHRRLVPETDQGRILREHGPGLLDLVAAFTKSSAARRRAISGVAILRSHRAREERCQNQAIPRVAAMTTATTTATAMLWVAPAAPASPLATKSSFRPARRLRRWHPRLRPSPSGPGSARAPRQILRRGIAIRRFLCETRFYDPAQWLRERPDSRRAAARGSSFQDRRERVDGGLLGTRACPSPSRRGSSRMRIGRIESPPPFPRPVLGDI